MGHVPTALPILLALLASPSVNDARAALAGLAPGALSLSPMALRLRAPRPAPELLALGGRPGGEVADACSDDLCPPRVSIEGYDPVVDAHARKTALALALLRRVGWTPLSRAADAIATTGLALDVRPGQLESLAGRAHRGWGEARLFVRWRLDAWNAPTWAAPSR